MRSRPKTKLQIVTKPSAQPKTKRLTLTLDTAVYAALESLATEQRRELRAQCVFVLEAAIKAHQGQKRTRQRKEAIKRRWEDGI